MHLAWIKPEVFVWMREFPGEIGSNVRDENESDSGGSFAIWQLFKYAKPIFISQETSM